MDSIYALSSGAVPSGVAVIRISGPLAGPALTALVRALPAPRHATLRSLRRPADGALLDQGLVLWFPGPRSETGEDMAELQIHGGRAVIAAVFHELSGLGLRLAEPGEFARRAFAGGKLDLTEIEGLGDLIAAETESQRVQALGQARGDLARRAEDWRGRLIALRAEVEARLDFSDEGDVAEELPESFFRNVLALKDELGKALATAEAGERVREGFRVAILGRPNAGKSSLLNALARRDVAIVTPEPGTTRDVLEVPLVVDGHALVIQDTAGLRETTSLAEGEGVRRARFTAESADLVLWLTDGSDGDSLSPAPPGAPFWRIRSKIDLCAARCGEFGVSALTGEGLAELERRLGEAAAAAAGREPALVTHRRQRDAIFQASTALAAAEAAVSDEIRADLLREAGDAIGRLSGRIGVENVLDRVFSAFCIGK